MFCCARPLGELREKRGTNSFTSAKSKLRNEGKVLKETYLQVEEEEGVQAEV